MLDLRLPIGYFFLINAVLLIGFGLLQPSTVPLGQEQINLNLIWGCVMCAFGLFMVALPRLDKKNSDVADGDKA